MISEKLAVENANGGRELVARERDGSLKGSMRRVDRLEEARIWVNEN